MSAAPGRRLAALNGKVMRLHRRGDYAAAFEPATEAAVLAREHYGPRHAQLAKALSNLGALHHELSRHAQAEACYREALEIDRACYGEGSAAVAADLLNLAALYDTRGDYAQAERLYRKAVAGFRRDPGERSDACATALRNLGMLQLETGRFGPAERNLRHALRIRTALAREGGGSARVAAAVSDLVSVLHARGRFSAALRLQKQAVTEFRPAARTLPIEYASALQRLGAIYRAMGGHDVAAVYYREALGLLRRTVGEGSAHVATAEHTLALVCAEQGNLDEAEQLYLSSLRTRLALHGERHPFTANTMSGLGEVYRMRGDFARAARLLGGALAIHREVYGAVHPVTGNGLNNLGIVYLATGRHERARALLEEALEVRRAVLGPTHPETAHTLVNLAVLDVARGDAASASERLARAAELDDATLNEFMAVGSEAERGTYLWSLRRYFDTLLTLALRPGAGDAPVAAAFAVVLRRKALNEEALQVQRGALRAGSRSAASRAARELAGVQQRIAALALSASAAGEGDTHARRARALQAERQRLEAEVARKLPAMRLGPRLRGLRHPAVAAALPPGGALVEVVLYHPLDLDAIVAGQPFGWRPPRYAAFIVRSGDPERVAVVELGSGDAVEGAIEAFRSAMPGGGRHVGRTADGRDVQAHARTLHDLVFAPLAPHLDGCARLWIAPDGELARLPFQVLSPAPGRHLADERRIVYLGSGRDLLRPAAPGGQPGPPLVAADPDFDLSPGAAAAAGPVSGPRTAPAGSGGAAGLRGAVDRFERLPGSRDEGERVAALLGVRPVCGAAVLEPRIARCRSPRILHLATHGFFLPNVGGGGDGGRLPALARVDDPLLRSALAMAGANRWLRGESLPPGAGNGFLTARTVLAMDLSATELVVLSACETGLGQVQAGEGVAGLRRAFMAAGARAVVMSLWKVSDRETCALMVGFYQRLVAGATPADALREAQLALKATHPDVYSWGAFIYLERGDRPAR